VNFDPIWSHPKPVQRPHPPILLGNNHANARQRVVEFCDGWFPIASRVADLAAAVADLRRRAEQAGRNPTSISVSVFFAKPEESAIRDYARIGVERVIFAVPSAGRDSTLPVLDKYATLAKTFGG
jgi:alkanesulfonate monooxygenase SsuD/methylene tetrahydromethanopterin reductase-like flavin-dependent oxidoreductase (luciferase family)